jgi:hypothetical protein
VWSRVFGRSKDAVPPAKLVEHLHAQGLKVEPHFKGDDLGWTAGELRLAIGTPILLERYLTAEDDLRDDLNAFAAELETMDYSPNHTMLMERVIQTQQLMTIRKPANCPDESLVENVIGATLKYLAVNCDGIYQIDRAGWFDASGNELIHEY